jgi:leucyl/phenylalanyl-tRNA--protein transferase
MVFETERLNLPVAASGRAARRAALFRESPLETIERWVLGVAWGLMPERIGGLLDLAKLCFEELLAPDYALPDPQRAFDQPPGLVGIVHELSLPTLLAAYRRGLYPLAHVGPLKWWSPPQRSLLFFDNFHMSNNLRRLMRQGRYTVTFDQDFERVLVGCAGKRHGRWHLTWITPRIMRVYADAFDAGAAHSFEVWNAQGALVGGGYGVTTGAAFCFESQFAQEPNASKLGMSVLNWHLARWGFHFNDGKLIGPLWQSVGFREVPRHEFLTRLAAAAKAPGKSGRWRVETDLETVSHWKP